MSIMHLKIAFVQRALVLSIMYRSLDVQVRLDYTEERNSYIHSKRLYKVIALINNRLTPTTLPFPYGQ